MLIRTKVTLKVNKRETLFYFEFYAGGAFL